MTSSNALGLVRFGSSSARISWREASISRLDNFANNIGNVESFSGGVPRV